MCVDVQLATIVYLDVLRFDAVDEMLDERVEQRQVLLVGGQQALPAQQRVQHLHVTANSTCNMYTYWFIYMLYLISNDSQQHSNETMPINLGPTSSVNSLIDRSGR